MGIKFYDSNGKYWGEYDETRNLFIPSEEPITKTETQNSNLTFEKVMEEIQTQVIEFPDTHQKFTFARKIEMDGDSIKIGGWEYKGVKDAERFVKGSEQTERSE